MLFLSKFLALCLLSSAIVYGKGGDRPRRTPTTRQWNVSPYRQFILRFDVRDRYALGSRTRNSNRAANFVNSLPLDEFRVSRYYQRNPRFYGVSFCFLTDLPERDHETPFAIRREAMKQITKVLIENGFRRSRFEISALHHRSSSPCYI